MKGGGRLAMQVTLLVAALSAVLAVTEPIRDTDFWQHLAVGRAIWELGVVPTTQLWSWPSYGTPDVNSSWGFRALVWPFWNAGGLWGLYGWRWATTLLALGILYLTARRLGARGFGAVLATTVCALVYSQRAQVRPETLVAVLLALEIALLEARRQSPGPNLARSFALAGILWAWTNTHISSPLGFALLGVFLLDDLWGRGGRAPRRSAGARAPVDPGGGGRTSKTGRSVRVAELLATGLAGLLLSLLNPFGWAALAQAFEFAFQQRGEAIFQTIGEIGPLEWSANLRNGLPLLLPGWPALLLWRARRQGWDRVELALCIGLTALALGVQRFTGFYALAALPYVARDLDAWLGSRRWPAWTSPASVRAGLTCFGCLALGAIEWTSAPLGVALHSRSFPVVACDFIERHGVRGRAFNPFHLGGYMLHRFWPDRGRLPFMDIHQAGTLDHRLDYLSAMTELAGWRRLREVYGIEFVLGWRIQVEGDRLIDFLDADTTFALVFADDAAALYVRRRGPLAAVADSFAYRELPAGRAALAELGEACARDPALRRRVEAELGRQAESSRWNATAASLLANVALLDGRWDEAKRRLEHALQVDPATPRIHERLGIVALETGRPREALKEFRRQRRETPRNPALSFLIARTHRALGHLAEARRAYERAAEHPAFREAARESLGALEGGIRP